jgi:hypothetical protein
MLDSLDRLLESNGISAQALAAFTCAPSEDTLSKALEVIQRLTALDIASQREANGEPREVVRRGPLRVPQAEALKRVALLREWASVQKDNCRKRRGDRITRATFIEEKGGTEQDLKKCQVWYHKHVECDEFPHDPRNLKDEQVRKPFPTQ